MASLAEAYGARGVGPRRLRAGVGLFAVGALAVFAGVLMATTDLVAGSGLTVLEARELAGVVAGLGLPLSFLAVVAVLPASRPVRAAAVIGGAIAVLGVGLFTWAYPTRWVGTPGPNATHLVAAVYLLGALTVGLCLFWTVARFKARSDPGGTVRLEVTEAGTRVVSVSEDLRRRLGGVGFLGVSPDGDTPTQTARPGRTDGGATTDDAVVLGESEDGPGSLADPYCGNCARFRYVRVDGEIQPYCGAHEEFMDDMDPCDQWEPNT
jgi:MFS family permease